MIEGSYSRISSTAPSYFKPNSIKANATMTGARPNPATQWTATQPSGFSLYLKQSIASVINLHFSLLQSLTFVSTLQTTRRQCWAVGRCRLHKPSHELQCPRSREHRSCSLARKREPPSTRYAFAAPARDIQRTLASKEFINFEGLREQTIFHERSNNPTSRCVKWDVFEYPRIEVFDSGNSHHQIWLNCCVARPVGDQKFHALEFNAGWRWSNILLPHADRCH
jgi:hypothetical protein